MTMSLTTSQNMQYEIVSLRHDTVKFRHRELHLRKGNYIL